MPGRLTLVGTPIGNLSDLSPRALEALRECDFIAAEDTRVTLNLLNHFGIRKPLVSYFEHNKRERGGQICARLEAGENAVLVTDAGMPAISDPGGELTALCYERGIPVGVVPGPSAVVTALAVSGMPAGRFTFEGFLSMNRRSRAEHLSQLREEKRTMVFYEAPHKLRATLQDLYDTLGDRRISIARELTKKFEEICLMTLSQAIEKYEQTPPKGEFALVIEGKTEQETEDYAELPIEAHVKRYTDAGMSEMEAIKAAAKDRGLRKNEVYAMIKKR